MDVFPPLGKKCRYYCGAVHPYAGMLKSVGFQSLARKEVGDD